ncbi:MAG: LLM class flavin-dependent oxidoreductase [Mangrovibacterium sp.]
MITPFAVIKFCVELFKFIQSKQIMPLSKAIEISVLDLAPVSEGSTPAEALRNSLDLAQHVEQFGYKRFWVAEHHNMINVASAATAVIIGYIAQGTSSIRVGSGGIMLPNHSPLIVSEQFGTLASLYPGRIDLGLGRAPGTDPVTAREIRSDRHAAVNDFPNEVRKLQRYFSKENQRSVVRSILAEGTDVPFWILGSSTDSAYLAAEMGLPYAFASHFAPAQLLAAINIYRENFKPSAQLDKPYVMIGVNVVACETDAGAFKQAATMKQLFLGVITGKRQLMQPPVDQLPESWVYYRPAVEQMIACSLIGGRVKIKEDLNELLELTQADEIMVVSHIYDHQTRIESFRIFTEICSGT